ncbi:DUF6445 family protein [Ralstonia solanacearum]|uniref:Uncharacterized protein n=1 Tax=Ralstonia solanacearum TaxID=305 RepID=A0AAD0WIC2_RALSL|nr:DUF6445 family protein [Ralstonia solanacearum]AXV84033.1 hypothetical protein CJO77_21070 [Ralstonia solanacearum]AXW55163.1 hypothetical protein CJO92_21080 [Ralstonia solanacearum]CBJ35319.1 hypothethical protein [Ralstonia solanacearum PSI07]
MLETIIVADDFYRDPEDVRAFALSQDFTVKGNYPGTRTQPFLHDGISAAIQALVNAPLTYWPVDTYNGAFQFSIEHDRTWVHADHTTTWSGVLYLTPNAPSNAGTAFFRHRGTGLDIYPDDASLRRRCDDDASIWERWSITDQIANRFNRLILFRGKRFHCSQGHFGDCKENGRLFQTFFFNTAY